MAKLNNLERGELTDVIKIDYVELNSIKNGRAYDSGEKLETAGICQIAEAPYAGCVDLTIVSVIEEFVGASDVKIDVLMGGVSLLGGKTHYLVGQTSIPISLSVQGSTESLTAGKILIGIRIIDIAKYA